MILPSSTWSLAPFGRLRASGNCTSATGAWVSLGTRMLTSTMSCPVLLSTAVCSIAHSSGPLRATLLQRADQPGCGAADGSGCGAGAAGVACAAARGVLAFGAWAWAGDLVRAAGGNL